MFKIVHLITGLGLGGAEKQLSHLVLNSDSDRFKHIVISMQDDGELGSKLIEQGIPLYTLNMPRGRLSFLGIIRLAKILRSVHPDILQTWLYHADILGLLVGIYLGISKIVWNIRCSNMNVKNYRKLTGLVIKICSALSSLPVAVIVNSIAGQKLHQTLGYRVKNWVNIPNGFKTELFKPDLQAREKIRKELNLSESTPVIGMIARFDPMKDHFTFLIAVKELLNRKSCMTRMKDLRVILVGAGLDRGNETLMLKITELQLEDHVYLLGIKHNIVELMNAFDVLVLSSAFGEGFPNVLGEAMACGVPCVATDVGDSARIIGDTGKIVQATNPVELANALEELLTLDRKARCRLGMLARERILNNFNSQIIVKQYEDIYECLCMNTQSIGLV